MLRSRWLFILSPLVLLVVGGGWYAWPMLQIGSGYAAKMACTCHFVQGRSLDDIQAAELNFSVLPYARLSADSAAGVVSASFWGLARRQAHYLGSRGCVLQAPGASLDLPQTPAHNPNATPPYPRWDTLPPGLDSAALRQAVADAFAPLPGGGTRAVVVLYDGRLAAEAYAPGFGPDTPLLGWSMTKSLINALVGMRVGQGKLALDTQGLFPDWKNDARNQINLRHLLHMNSGLSWNEAYGSTSDATSMLYLAPHMANYTARQPLAHPPGQQWVYASGTSNLLSQLLRNTFPSDQAFAAFVRDSLFVPLGMTAAFIEPDHSGGLVGSSYGWATARGWANFGQLYLQDGVWQGQRLLPEGWVQFSRQPAAGSEGRYGAHIWLKGPDTPGVPDDTFMFRGFQDQRVCIIPSRRAVVVRLGMNDDNAFNLDQFLRKVLAALPG